ncbi:MAG TPA: heterodisulfide reductase [Chloroflexi bacterium]|nr:heterodisulfide reductase [Chloroflexota bacterium]
MENALCPQRLRVMKKLTVRFVRQSGEGTSRTRRCPLAHSPTPGDGLSLLEAVERKTPIPSRLEMCIQCGSCGGSCPSAADMEHTPRAIFALLRAGMDESVLHSNTPWICVSCYQCMVRCPQEIPITDIMYAIKNIAIQRGAAHKEEAAFSATFAEMVESYGRSFELGLATRYYLKHHPLRLPGMAPLGMGMLARRRMDLKPTRIKDVDGLRDILQAAREMEAAQ